MTDEDSWTAGLAELKALRERLAFLEEMARAVPPPKPEKGAPPMNLESAVGGHYKDADAKATNDPLASWGPFREDPAIERTIAARAAHPEAYGPPDFAEAVYTDRKRAAAAAKGATE